jgi:glycosyltransferase involved in cell wall biosynthesis
MTPSSDTLLPPPDLKTKTSGDMSGPAEKAIDRRTVAAVIPAYLEEKHIADVVCRTLEQLDNVLVVDDGSPDATAEAARNAGAEVIVHPQNIGKGESIKTGLRHWLKGEFDYVVILDADGQHRPEEIERFLAAASSSGADLLIGTRMNDMGEMPLVRRWVNRYMSNRISRVCGQPIPDTQCGFRMINRSIIPDLLGGAERFDYETEVLIIACRKGCRVESVSITTVYSDEVSSIHPARDTIRFFRLLRRYKKS